jgi:TPR repeat protein
MCEDEMGDLAIEKATRRGKEAMARKNYVEAMHYYKSAAERGSAQAQCEVGSLFLYGLGVQRNFPEARRWLQLSAAGGSEAARRILEFVVG